MAPVPKPNPDRSGLRDPCHTMLPKSATIAPKEEERDCATLLRNCIPAWLPVRHSGCRPSNLLNSKLLRRLCTHMIDMFHCIQSTLKNVEYFYLPRLYLINY